MVDEFNVTLDSKGLSMRATPVMCTGITCVYILALWDHYKYAELACCSNHGYSENCPWIPLTRNIFWIYEF